MRKIAVFNQKGGVGKTTTSVNLAAGLSRNNKKVLLIDLDPQGDISVCHNTDSKFNLYHFLMDGIDLQQCISKLGKNLDIINCDHKLMDVENEIAKDKHQISFLDKKFDLKLDYDYIILDCAPSWRLLTKNALYYTSEIIIPCSTDVLGYDSLEKTIKRIVELNRLSDRKLVVSSVLPTMFDSRSKICTEILQKMKKEFTPLLVSGPIRTNSKLKEAPKAKMSIFSYDKKSSGAEDYWKFVKLILENEYMYDLNISQLQRNKAIEDYFVNGKKREMMIIGNKVTFGFKFVTSFGSNLKSRFIEKKKRKLSYAQ